MHAASANNVPNIKYLLETEKDVHSPTNYTALMIAVENGFYEATRCLISQAGVRVGSNDPKYKAGTTALVISMEC